jgi:hypothetical protein
MVSKRVRHYQNNFTKGEIDPSLWGHGDLSGYYDGVACAENVWINGSGSAVKRYGLARVHSYTAANYAKMYPLDIVSGAHYLIVVTAGHIDVLNGGSGVLVASMGAPLFTEGIVPDLYGLASQDSVIFTHNAVPPQQFKWIGGDNFTFTEIALVNIPSFEFTVNDVHPVRPEEVAHFPFNGEKWSDISVPSHFN